MKNPLKSIMGKRPKSAAEIESEIEKLKLKLAENESRRSAALQTLVEAQAARRDVLGEDDAVVEQASARVRKAQLEADDMAALVGEYLNAIAAAEDRLQSAIDQEGRLKVIAILEKAAADVEALGPDLQKAVSQLMKVLGDIRAAIPDDFGVFPCDYSHRPEDRPEGSTTMLSPREIVNALLAEALYGADPTRFDRYKGKFEYGLGLMKLLEPASASPGYINGYARSEKLTIPKALDALIVARARKRAADIAAGDIEPILSKIAPISRPTSDTTAVAEDIEEAARATG